MENTPEADTPISVPLTVLVAAALENNLAFLSERASTNAAVSGVARAEGAFDPAVTMRTDYSEDKSFTFGSPPATITHTATHKAGVSGAGKSSLGYDFSAISKRTSASPQTAFLRASFDNTLNLTLTQPLLKGQGWIIATASLEIAKLTAAASQASLRRVSDRTISDVENAYWLLLQNEESERVIRESVALAKSLLNRNQEMLRLRLVSELDVVTAERGMASREADLILARKDRKDAAEALVFLVFGEQAAAEIHGGKASIKTEPVNLAPPAIPNPDMAESRALSVREDVRAAERIADQFALSLKVAKDALKPDLKLIGAGTWGGVTRDRKFTEFGERTGDVDKATWSGAVVFTKPLGNTAPEADYIKAMSDYETKRLALVSARNVVRVEVRAALRGVLAGRDRLAKAQAAYEASARQLSGEKKKLQLGLTDSFRLLQVEQEHTTSGRTAAAARYEFATTVTKYYFVMGEISRRYAP